MHAVDLLDGLKRAGVKGELARLGEKAARVNFCLSG